MSDQDLDVLLGERTYALVDLVLIDAASQDGLGRVTLVPEPVAAASYVARVLGHQVPTGACVVVYDLGAGTFDASVVRHGPDGLDTLACRGLDDFGGLDLDAMVVEWIGGPRCGSPPCPHSWRWRCSSRWRCGPPPTGSASSPCGRPTRCSSRWHRTRPAPGSPMPPSAGAEVYAAIS